MTRDQYIRLEIPHYVFAPSGRLYTIEAICEAIERDENSNTVVVLQVAQGIVIVTTVPSSPYMKNLQESIEAQKKRQTEQQNDDDCWSSSLWLSEEDVGISPTVSAPFLRVVGSDRILAVTAGNPLEAQILRSRIKEIAQNVHDEFGTSGQSRHDDNKEEEDIPLHEFLETVARQLADDNQLRTQQFQHGKVLAATMILIMAAPHTPSNHILETAVAHHHTSQQHPGIYRIDPTGQFFPCQAVVAGRRASQLETWLQNQLVQFHKNETTTTRKNPNASVRTVLAQQLSLEQALVLARDCILQAQTTTTSSMKSSANTIDGTTTTTFRSNSKVRLRGIVMPKHGNRIQCFTSKELYALHYSGNT
jgi:20S proteasome alpha/beta subunit